MRNRKYYGITGQLLIILVFFSGMILNYYLLFPLINSEEEARIIGELDNYCFNFDDPVAIPVPDPYSGDFIIMGSDSIITYSNRGISGNACRYVEQTYGKIAIDILNLEFTNPTFRSRLVYDEPKNISYYVSYEPGYGTMFFYAVDYAIAGKGVGLKYRILLLVMTVGGLAIIIVSLFNIRKLTDKVRNESANKKELETASSIQMSMLPRGEKHLMQLDVNARLIPAKKVGGDLFCYLLKEGYLYFCIGDVSGKGVPASLCMSKTVSLFRSLASNSLSPLEIANHLNEELCINNDLNMFVTAFIGTVRIYDGYITFCNAGHDPAIYLDGNADSSAELVGTSHNLPLGVIPSFKYEEGTMTMAKNALLFFYTDGVTEAKSRKAKFFGRDNLIKTIESVQSLTAKEINDKVINDVMNFETGIEQSDDITVLSFKNVVRSKTLTIDNEIKELRKIAAFTQEIFDECPLDGKSRILVRSGLDEALTNCVRYAYGKEKGKIDVSASLEDGYLSFVIKDSGIEFNPLEYMPQKSEDLKIGGLGISMYRNNFDIVEYERRDDANILKLKKHL